MILKKEDKSFNLNVTPIKEYTRKIFWCRGDDVWLTQEVPD